MTPTGTFSVAANNENGVRLQNTGSLPAVCDFTAAGSWSDATTGLTGPGGSAGFACPTCVHFAAGVAKLIAKTSYGFPTLIGASRSNVALSPGQYLDFMINDVSGQFGSNPGSVTVSHACRTAPIAATTPNVGGIWKNQGGDRITFTQSGNSVTGDWITNARPNFTGTVQRGSLDIVLILPDTVPTTFVNYLLDGGCAMAWRTGGYWLKESCGP